MNVFADEVSILSTGRSRHCDNDDRISWLREATCEGVSDCRAREVGYDGSARTAILKVFRYHFKVTYGA